MNTLSTFLSAALLVASGHAAVQTPAQLATDLANAAQADVIGLAGVNPVSAPEIPMTATWGGGSLLLSDSPESPTVKAMLYKDPGLLATGAVPNRLFVYHANNKPSGYLRFSVLIKNNGAASGTLTVQKAGTAGPSTAYGYVGKLAFKRWLDSTATSGVSVSAGQTVRLDTVFDTLDIAKGYVLHGIWDYTFTQAHTVMICALDSGDNSITVGPTLAVAARDTHVRGTFIYADKTYDTSAGVVVDTAAGIQQFPIGGNSDVFVTGHDYAVAVPTAETNTGNYGVLYRMHLATSCSDGRNFGLLLNPRAGGWGGAIWLPAGLLAGGKFLIPVSTVMLSDNTKAAVAGKYNTGTGATVWAQFMPTAASAFPIRLVTVPY
ncbi:MAG: hypothetical protein EXS37_13170 [Opitutus sp.]|nr:hypothetical protein [Opitutus sp.]